MAALIPINWEKIDSYFALKSFEIEGNYLRAGSS